MEPTLSGLFFDYILSVCHVIISVIRIVDQYMESSFVVKLRHIILSMALINSAPVQAAYHWTPSPVEYCRQHQLLAPLNKNQSRFIAQCGWLKRIKLSGYVKGTIGLANDVWGLSSSANDFNHNLSFNAGSGAENSVNVDSSHDVWLERAIINVDSELNDWAEAHVSLMHWNEHNIMSNADAMMYNRYHGSWREFNGNNLPVDEAYVVLGNFAQSPSFIRIGRQYGDFGWFEKREGLATLTQLFSQGVHDAIQIGFADVSGMSGSFSVFRSIDRGNTEEAGGSNSQDNPADGINNFIGTMDYYYDDGVFIVDGKLDYVRDMFAVDFLDGYSGNGILGGPAVGTTHAASSSNKRPTLSTPAMAFTLKSMYGNFDGMYQWVGATRRMDKDVWTTGGHGSSNFIDPDVKGARPSAWMVEVGYSFPMMGRDTRLAFNYQRSDDAMVGSHNTAGDADNYYIPAKRYFFSFEHDLSKNVSMRLGFYRDTDYEAGHFQSANNRASSGDSPGEEFETTSGTGNSNSLFVLNIDAQFS